MPPLVLDSGFHFNFDVVIFTLFPFIHVNVPLGMSLLRGLIMNFLLGNQFSNLDFLKLMIRSWKMLTKEVEKWTSTSKFGQWMCSMNGDNFVVLTQWNLLLICLKMKVWSRTLRICCHLLFCTLKKKLATYILQLSKKKLPFLESFYNWVFFLIMCFSCFYFVYDSISYVFFFSILGLRFIWRF